MEIRAKLFAIGINLGFRGMIYYGDVIDALVNDKELIEREKNNKEIKNRKMFNVKKNDLKRRKYKEMKNYDEKYESLPDGAFFALAKEVHGWEACDWGWFSEVQDFDEDYN